MKKFFLALAMTYAVSAPADTGMKPQYKPVYCAPFAELLQALTSDRYKELPVWAAKDAADDSRYVLFVNGKNKNWTLIQVWKSTGCILGAGTDGQAMDGIPGI